jgi:hypothetical protein
MERTDALRWWRRGLIALAFLPTAARAQLPGATLTGHVSGGRAAVARVIAECHGDPSVSRTAAVESDGTFVMDELPPGPCRVRAEAGDESGGTVEVLLAAGEERKVDLALVTARRASSAPSYITRSTEGPIPLPTRSIEALVQMSGALDGDRGPWSGIHGSALYGNQYGVDGFDLTDPLGGGPVVDLPLIEYPQVAAVTAAGGATRAWSTGADIEARGLVGSNRLDVDTFGSYLGGAAGGPRGRASAQEVEAGLSSNGPVLKDHLWFAVGAEGRWTDGRLAGGAAAPGERLSSPRWSGKLTWQASPRHKITLLGIGSDEELSVGDGDAAAAATTRGRLVGLFWEALPADNVFTRGQVAWRHRRLAAGTDTDVATAWEASARAHWWLSGWTEQQVIFGVRHEWQEARPGEGAAVDGRRTLLSLEDQWRPTRSLTVTPGLAYVLGSFAAPRGPAPVFSMSGAAPHLALAWDATHDGRTVVRASAGRSIDAGSFTHADAAAAQATPVTTPQSWEVTAGAQREVAAAMVLGADVVQRWHLAQLALDPRERIHRALALSLRKQSGGLAYAAVYRRQSTPGAHDTANLTVTAGLPWGASFATTAFYGNRLAFSRLAPGYLEPDGFVSTSDGGGSGWHLDARLRLDLRRTIGQDLTAWVDLLDVFDDHTTVGAPSTAPTLALQRPGRQVRAGMSWRY